jgi:hypothetical protein
MNTEIKVILDRLKDGMLSFIEDEEDAPYTTTEVNKCMGLISAFLDDLQKTSSKAEGMKIVEKTVLSLNELNEQCHSALIETDQREDICEIIIIAGNKKGYNELSEDITEEWREW